MRKYLLLHLLIAICYCRSQAQPNKLEVLMPACTSTCTGTLGDNIFPNGDFGSGLPNIYPINPNLAPGFIYTLSPPPDDGYYCIANNTSPWGSFAQTYWIDIEDNGPEPNGYMMVVNATYPPGLFYQNTVSVCENTLYEFSIDIISLIKNHVQGFILPNISFLIDGIVVCETGNIPQDEQWRTVRFSFVSSPVQNTVTLALRNNAPGGGGNDLAIDNISFRACGPSIMVSETAPFCKDAPATITSALANSPYNNPVYQWQIFSNGAWVDIPNANSDSLQILNPVDGSMIRLVVASSPANLALPNCRVVSKTVVMTQLPNPVVNTTAQDVSCAGSSDATASVNVISGTSPFGYLWNAGQSTQSIANLSAGIYQVTVTDFFGCSEISSVTVSEPNVLTTSASSTSVSCFGSNDGAAISTATGGVSPYGYLWGNGLTDAAITGLVAGNYLVTVTDFNGCKAINAVAVTEPTALTTSVSTNSVSCFGSNDGSAISMAAGGVSPFNFIWSNGETNAALSNLIAGTYTVTVTDFNGCTETTSINVSEPPGLTASTSTSNVSCFGNNDGAVLSMAAGGVSPFHFIWSNGETNAALSNLFAGIYSVTVTDFNGCTEITSVNVSEPPSLIANVNTTSVSCFGNNDGTALSMAAGGVPPFNFMWSNGDTNAVIANLIAGIYTVTVTDLNGCTTLYTVSIAEPTGLTASVSTTSISCFGGNDGAAISMSSGGISPYNYLWSNGQTDAAISNLLAGTYQVTVSDSNGCSGVSAVAVSEPTALTTSASTISVSCFGFNDGVATSTAAGGVSPFNYLWSNSQTTATISNLLAGTYHVTVSDFNACTAVNTVNIAEPTALTTSVSTTSVSCNGYEDGSASATLAGGVPPYNYWWGNGQTDASITHLLAGVYAYTATDANGCTVSDAANITQPPLLAASVSVVDVSCFGENDGNAMALLAGGVPPYTYLWSNGHTLGLNENLVAGTYNVTATDDNGCSLVGSATVNQPSAIELSTGVENVDCHGNSTGAVSAIIAGGTLPYSLHWNNGANTPQIEHLPIGTYILSIADANGCVMTATTQISEPPPLIAQTDKTDIRCFGYNDGTLSSFAIGGVAPYSIQWSSGQTTADITGLAAGTYTVSVTDGNGCIVEASQYLAEPILPTVNLGNDLVVHLGDYIDLTAIVNIPQSEVQDYTWSGSEDSLHCAGCFNYRFQPTGPGCQQVLVRSKKGCLAMDIFCYKINPHLRIYAPNVFAPDGDGVNDFFTIFSDDGVKQILSLSIYNRWGGHIYQAHNIQTNDEPVGWDGTFRGQELNMDVFVWVAELELIDGQKITLKGDVTLVR